jgi:hypothetical protein
MYSGDPRELSFSQFLQHLAGEINTSGTEILGHIDEISEHETYVYPYLEREQFLFEMAQHEPVKFYYNLTEDTKSAYF